jgi:hypothetical protein
MAKKLFSLRNDFGIKKCFKYKFLTVLPYL